MHRGNDSSTNHTIIFCDCPNFDYSDPVWVLSHELSHFVLNYVGFDLQLVEEEIHSLDKKYDICVEGGYDESCSLVKTKIETQRADWIVMAPYEPAIGKNPYTFESSMENHNSPYQDQMMLEITKWWLQKDITDENYLKSLQILSGNEKNDELKSLELFASSPLKILTEPSHDKKEFTERETPFELTNHAMRMMPFRPIRSDRRPACGPVSTFATPPTRNMSAICSPVMPRSRSSHVGR